MQKKSVKKFRVKNIKTIVLKKLKKIRIKKLKIIVLKKLKKYVKKYRVKNTPYFQSPNVQIIRLWSIIFIILEIQDRSKCFLIIFEKQAAKSATAKSEVPGNPDNVPKNIVNVTKVWTHLKTATLTSMVGGFRSYLISLVCIYYIYPNESYPGLTDEGKSFTISWMGPIIVRNIIGTIVICGFWDWFLYFSPLKVRFLLER